MSEPTPSPKRLVDQDDSLGSLLRQAEEEFRDGLDANRALLRLRDRRRSLVRGSWLLAGAAAVAAVGLLATLPGRGGIAPASLTAEALGSKIDAPVADQAERRASTAEPARAQPAPEPARTAARETPRGDAKPAAVLPSAKSVAAPPTPAAPAEAVAAAPAAAAPERDCLSFARAGDPQAAATCFSERANGDGLSAQVALYELSRLERDALGKPAAALVTLDRYLERFPAGSLNGEARFSRLELLARLGRTREALDASQAFLGSSFGVERAAEVHLLRGNLLLREGQATAAAVEFRAALDAPGRVGDDAAYQLGIALENGGDVARARAAYERYLERAGARHAAAARARLAALRP